MSCEKLNPPPPCAEVPVAGVLDCAGVVAPGDGVLLARDDATLPGLDVAGDVVRPADDVLTVLVGPLLVRGGLFDAALLVPLDAGRVVDDEDAAAGGAAASKLSLSNSKNPMLSRKHASCNHSHVWPTIRRRCGTHYEWDRKQWSVRYGTKPNAKLIRVSWLPCGCVAHFFVFTVRALLLARRTKRV